MFTSRHQHGVLHCIPNDLRIDAFLLAQDFDGLINVTQAGHVSDSSDLGDYHSNFRFALSTSSRGNWMLLPGEGSSVMIPSAKLCRAPTQCFWFSTGWRRTIFTL